MIAMNLQDYEEADSWVELILDMDVFKNYGEELSAMNSGKERLFRLTNSVQSLIFIKPGVELGALMPLSNSDCVIAFDFLEPGVERQSDQAGGAVPFFANMPSRQ